MSDLLPFAAATVPSKWVRPRIIAVEQVDLAVTIDLDQRTAEGEVTHRCRWIAGAKPVVEFDARELAVPEAWINGIPVTVTRLAESVRLGVPGELPADLPFHVRMRFRVVEPRKGLVFVDPGADRVAMAWTQGAMEDHSYWFPCYDSPNNLATYAIAIRHRSRFQAIANGDRADRAEHGDGWATTTWLQPRPHVLYLVNVAVGDFVAVQDTAGTLPITHWLPVGSEACAEAVFRATRFAIAELERLTGVPYPWTRYGHVVVHRFTWGGMENTTLTTITDRVLATAEDQRREDVDCDYLVIHELVHQWYGDLLTMKGWSDIWLNESFATYLEAVVTAKYRAATRGDVEQHALALELWHNRAAYLEQDGSRYRRALVTNRWEDADELFDRVAYEQGSLVLHHLRSVLGDDAWLRSIRLYTARHRHDLVETADLRQAIEDATGDPVDWFFDQWVHRAGHPKLKIAWSHDATRHQLTVTIDQTQTGEPLLAYRLPLTIAVAGQPPTTCIMTGLRQVAVISVDQVPAWVAVDPDGGLLAEWEDESPPAACGALVADAAAPLVARARACGLLAKKHPVAELLAAVATVVAAADTPELLREEAIACLATWRTEAAAKALIDGWSALTAERHRRLIATALGRFRRLPTTGDIARQLMTWADSAMLRGGSTTTAGDCLAARGTLEHPGAAPLLRSRLTAPSWQHRLRTGVIRGLAASLEAAAIDDLLGLLHDRTQPDAVHQTTLSALGRIGAHHRLAWDRIRTAIEPWLRADHLFLRVAAASGLGALGDPQARGALGEQLERECFGGAKRVLRESLHRLGILAQASEAQAKLAKRIDELESAKTRLEARLEALEKRLG